jgi:hypothetical protein
MQQEEIIDDIIHVFSDWVGSSIASLGKSLKRRMSLPKLLVVISSSLGGYIMREKHPGPSANFAKRFFSRWSSLPDTCKCLESSQPARASDRRWLGISYMHIRFPELPAF